MAKYPLVAASDCSVDMKQEIVDVCVTACERHAADVEKCTQVGGLMGPCVACAMRTG